MTQITDAMLKEWESLCERATKGPWRINFGDRHAPDECDIKIAGDIFILADMWGPNYEHCEPNAEFIAAARTALPLLIAELRRLRNG